MRISKRGEYALLALTCLAFHHGGRPLQIRDIAERCGAPPNFLEIILLQLKNQGILRSGRGKAGGYSLLTPPEQVTMADIIRTVDGPLAPLRCVSVWAHESCPKEAACGLRDVMKEVRDAIAKILEGITLAELRDRTPGPQRQRYLAAAAPAEPKPRARARRAPRP